MKSTKSKHINETRKHINTVSHIQDHDTHEKLFTCLSKHVFLRQDQDSDISTRLSIHLWFKAKSFTEFLKIFYFSGFYFLKMCFCFCVISASVISSYTETTLPCSSSNTSLRKLLWRFNHGQIILTKTGPDAKYTVSERWKQHVRGVSESGSLTLQNLSADQEGTYTCELSDASETITTNIFVKLNQGKINQEFVTYMRKSCYHLLLHV